MCWESFSSEFEDLKRRVRGWMGVASKKKKRESRRTRKVEPGDGDVRRSKQR